MTLSEVILPGSSDKDDMGKEDRKRAILRFLRDCDLALPPKVLHVNMKRKGATFSETTVNRHLAELLEEGLVEKPLENEGYYAISEEGRRTLTENDRSNG